METWSAMDIKQKFAIVTAVVAFLVGWGLTIAGLSAENARKLIKENAGLLPCNIRMEKGVSWLHFDVLPQYGVTDKVYEFSS